MQSKNTTRTTSAQKRVAHGKGRAVLAATALALGIGTIAFASPAVARDEFKNAFEFELGRIVAHEVAAVGHAILSPIVTVGHDVYIEPVVYQPRVIYREPHRRNFRKHARGHAYGHGHRHHRNCGHGYSRHDRRDRYDRYDRHDRRDRYDRYDRHDRRAAKHHKRVAKRIDRHHKRVSKRIDRHHDRVEKRRDRHHDRVTDRRDRRDDRRSDRRDRRY